MWKPNGDQKKKKKKKKKNIAWTHDAIENTSWESISARSTKNTEEQSGPAVLAGVTLFYDYCGIASLAPPKRTILMGEVCSWRKMFRVQRIHEFQRAQPCAMTWIGNDLYV
jgi:hypothetical protein